MVVAFLLVKRCCIRNDKGSEYVRIYSYRVIVAVFVCRKIDVCNKGICSQIEIYVSEIYDFYFSTHKVSVPSVGCCRLVIELPYYVGRCHRVQTCISHQYRHRSLYVGRKFCRRYKSFKLCIDLLCCFDKYQVVFNLSPLEIVASRKLFLVSSLFQHNSHSGYSVDCICRNVDCSRNNSSRICGVAQHTFVGCKLSVSVPINEYSDPCSNLRTRFHWCGIFYMYVHLVRYSFVKNRHGYSLVSCEV